MVDKTGLKTGQALTINLLLAGFVLNSVWPVLFVAVAQLLGAFNAPFAPYKLIYRYGVRRFVEPNPQRDNAEPHRFAMLVGALFNGTASLILLTVPELAVVAWVLVWIVIALANLNFWLNFCLGCWMYYQLNRLGVPGFTKAPIS